MRRCAALVAASAAAWLAGCAANLAPLPPPAADERARIVSRYLAYAAAGERVIHLDPSRSQLRIYVYRAGAAARLGHDHVLTAPDFLGYFHQPAAKPTEAGFDLLIRLDELAVDDPQLRATLGGAFAAPMDAKDVAGTREHLLGADGLQAERYPYVHVQALRIVGDAPRFAVQTRVELHGRARDLWVPMQVEGLPDTLTASGALVLHQTDFGVTPYSVLGGLLAVGDEVVVEFRLAGGGGP